MTKLLVSESMKLCLIPNCTLLGYHFVAWVQILASTLMWVEFVIGSLLCFERFFSRYSGFPLSLKANPFKFQFDLERADTFQRVLKNSKVLRGWTITICHFAILPFSSTAMSKLTCRFSKVYEESRFRPGVYPKLLRRWPESHGLLLSLRCLGWVLIIPVLFL